MALNMDFPLPDTDWPVLAPLWEGAKAGEFRLPRCTACGAFDWYPSGACRKCKGKVEWVALSGRGTLYTWAVVHRALHPPLAALGSYVPAIVAIEEDPGTRFVTRIVDADPANLSMNMPVRATFQDVGYPALAAGVTVPLFTPA